MVNTHVGVKKISRKLVVFLSTLLTAYTCATAVHAGDISFFSSFPELDMTRWYVSSGWANGDIQSCEWRADAVSGKENGLQLTLSDKGGKVRPLGCAEIHTNAKNNYGLYEARMRVASGSGLNTAFFTYIGKPEIAGNDEIDFEFLGKDTHFVQINYYTLGKGQHEKMIPLGFDASKGFHDYAIHWEPKKITWYVDGKMVYATPDNAVLPHTPAQIFLSLWSGSHSVDGWLGELHYKEPVTAQVAWVKYTAQK